uniref:Uncharacterized protein n=1 Tax=Anopheles minimus TaxID=112268 RepID=A0A182WPD5_9DIPT
MTGSSVLRVHFQCVWCKFSVSIVYASW